MSTSLYSNFNSRRNASKSRLVVVPHMFEHTSVIFIRSQVVLTLEIYHAVCRRQFLWLIFFSSAFLILGVLRVQRIVTSCDVFFVISLKVVSFRVFILNTPQLYRDRVQVRITNYATSLTHPTILLRACPHSVIIRLPLSNVFIDANNDHKLHILIEFGVVIFVIYSRLTLVQIRHQAICKLKFWLIAFLHLLVKVKIIAFFVVFLCAFVQVHLCPVFFKEKVQMEGRFFKNLFFLLITPLPLEFNKLLLLFLEQQQLLFRFYFRLNLLVKVFKHIRIDVSQLGLIRILVLSILFLISSFLF